jgi:hypothetical protein
MNKEQGRMSAQQLNKNNDEISARIRTGKSVWLYDKINPVTARHRGKRLCEYTL